MERLATTSNMGRAVHATKRNWAQPAPFPRSQPDANSRFWNPGVDIRMLTCGTTAAQGRNTTQPRSVRQPSTALVRQPSSGLRGNPVVLRSGDEGSCDVGGLSPPSHRGPLWRTCGGNLGVGIPFLASKLVPPVLMALNVLVRCCSDPVCRGSARSQSCF